MLSKINSKDAAAARSQDENDFMTFVAKTLGRMENVYQGVHFSVKLQTRGLDSEVAEIISRIFREFNHK